MPIDPAFLSWNPAGQTLGVRDSYRLVSVHDGDTPRIEMPIRMLSVDTPEVTAETPEGARRWNERLVELAGWIEAGQAPIDEGYAAAILPKLRHGAAGTLQFTQGQKASEFGKSNIARRLQRPNGRDRALFVRTADQPFDDFGRLLAYVAPSYSPEEREGLSLEERSTFNLDLVRSGWGAPFLIFPSLPRRADLELFVTTVEEAVREGRGAWAEPLQLTGYEYRMMEKLHGVTRSLLAGEPPRDGPKGWRSRLCIDMGTRDLRGPEDYLAVPHHRRLWVWPEDVDRARQAFGLAGG